MKGIPWWSSGISTEGGRRLISGQGIKILYLTCCRLSQKKQKRTADLIWLFPNSVPLPAPIVFYPLLSSVNGMTASPSEPARILGCNHESHFLLSILSPQLSSSTLYSVRSTCGIHVLTSIFTPATLDQTTIASSLYHSAAP